MHVVQGIWCLTKLMFYCITYTKLKIEKIDPPKIDIYIPISCTSKLRNFYSDQVLYMTLPHPFIPRKTANLIPEYAVEDLPMGRTATLVLEFAVKVLSLGRTL